MHITKEKRPIRKDCILHDFVSVSFWERQNYGNSKKISAYQRLWGGEDE
jgi:hypothetical protein